MKVAWRKALILAVCLTVLAATVLCYVGVRRAQNPTEPTTFIKWVEFNVPYEALEKALALDIKSRDEPPHMPWIDTLAYLASKYWGEFSRYHARDIDGYAAAIREGKSVQELTQKLKQYNYFHEAYTAVLGGFVDDFQIQTGPDKEYQIKYGLKAFYPIAKGYSVARYADFGNSRSYGYARTHQGNDLMGSVGIPIVAVEGGTIEALGWNQYGGWRIGIRTADKKRYYYYAHLRRNHPYAPDLQEGMVVQAGDVIGYMGMTGYSPVENTNNISTPHLHIGLQLIFDESQKDGANQIWIDPYNLISLLSANKSAVEKTQDGKDYRRVYQLRESDIS